jgi:germination protein M
MGNLYQPWLVLVTSTHSVCLGSIPHYWGGGARYKKHKKKMKKLPFSFLATLVALATIGATIALLAGCNQKTPEATPTPASASTPAPADSNTGPDPMKQSQDATPAPNSNADENTMTIFRVVSNDQGRHLEPETITLSTDITDDEAKLGAAIGMMTEGKNAPLPEGTKLRSLKIEGDTATVDLSKEYKSNFKGGDELESITVQAITGTVGEFKGVKQVQFLLEGEKIDSLGGNIAFDIPVPVPQELLKEKESESKHAKN